MCHARKQRPKEASLNLLTATPKIADFSYNGSRNVADQFFVPDVLVDFYSVRVSTATPSARSNVNWCGLRIFSSKFGVP